MMEIPEENGVKKGPWTPEEDQKLVDCIQKHGHGNWKELPKLAGLNRCGKSCRLRWTNYLRPDIKRGPFSDEEERLIIDLHAKLGNKWSAIASYLPGRTDNEIKNLWNTHLKKRLLQNGIDPVTHMPTTHLDSLLPILPQFLDPTWENVARIQTDAAKLAKILLVSNILQLLNTGGNSYPPLPMAASNPSTSVSAQIRSSQPGFSNDVFQPIFPDPHHKNDIFAGNTMVDHGLPDLVPASPRRLSTYDQTQDTVFPTGISNPASTSTTFEALGDLMDDEAANYDWKQILDQASALP